MALALILCDQLDQDSRTGKFNLTGTFFQFDARRFPIARTMCVYVCMTDGRGKTPVRVRLIDVDEERPPVFDYSLVIDFEEPGLVIEFGAEASDSWFTAPGKYRLQLIAADATILERSIYVDLLPSEQEN